MQRKRKSILIAASIKGGGTRESKKEGIKMRRRVTRKK